MIPGVDTGGGGFQGSSKSGDAIARTAVSAALDRSGNISFASKNNFLPWFVAGVAVSALLIVLLPRKRGG